MAAVALVQVSKLCIINGYTLDTEELREAGFQGVSLDVDKQLQERIMGIRDILATTTLGQVGKLPSEQRIHNRSVVNRIVVPGLLTVLEARWLFRAGNRIEFVLQCLQVDPDEFMTILLLAATKPILQHLCKLLKRPFSNIHIHEHLDDSGRTIAEQSLGGFCRMLDLRVRSN